MIISDNGPQLISADFTTFFSSKGIQDVKTAYCHS